MSNLFLNFFVFILYPIIVIIDIIIYYYESKKNNTSILIEFNKQNVFMKILDILAFIAFCINLVLLFINNY